MDYTALQRDIDFWTGTDTSSGTSFTSTERNRGINESYRRVNQWIWQASSEWEYDDSTYGTIPIAEQTLRTTGSLRDRGNYQIPSDAQNLLSVFVKDDSGDWVKLEAVDQAQIDHDPEQVWETSGMPSFYDKIADSLQLYPSPRASDVTANNGLKLRLSREVNTFNTTATTREPGFAEDFHRLLSLMPSYDYGVANNFETAKLDRIQGLINAKKQELQSYYGSRNRDRQGRMIPDSLKGHDAGSTFIGSV